MKKKQSLETIGFNKFMDQAFFKKTNKHTQKREKEIYGYEIKTFQIHPLL